MKKLKLSTFFDGIFIFFLSFFVFYALLKGVVKSIILTTFLSILFSSSATFLFALISEKVLGKKDVELKDKNEFETFINSLFFAEQKNIKKLIKAYYEKKNFEVLDKKDYLLLENENACVFFEFTPEKTKESSILNAYKKTPKGYKTIFISNGYDLSVKDFFIGFDRVSLYNGKDLYLSLKEENLIDVSIKNQPKKLKINFKQILRRENSKKFLLWGAVLLLFSTLTFYKWFYLITGSLFLILSLITRFFTLPKPNENKCLT
ncbi:MAG: hypothetical protein E7358_06715 [Clostridiales bacterium]|nr:hypothetical protein [Clostridiales bacterium]